MLSNSIFNYSSSYAELKACTYSQPNTCMDCIPKPTIHMYIENLWHTAFLPSLSFSHITKKNVSPEILLLQPGLCNTIHCSSWWRGNCCKIQLEVYGDRWRWIPLSVIPLSFSLPYKRTNMDSHTCQVTWNPPTIIPHPAHNCKGIFQQPGFGLSGQRFTAECAASLSLVGGGLLCRGIIHSHLIFISYWEIRDDKSVW